MKQYFVYIIEASDGSWYTGFTIDLQARFKKHVIGKGAKYFTKTRQPKRFVIAFEIDSTNQAMAIEWQIKQLTRANKEKVVKKAIDEDILLVNSTMYRTIQIFIPEVDLN